MAWMIDYGPLQWRLKGYQTLRNHPLFLAWSFRQLTAADLSTARNSWRAVRTAKDVSDPDRHPAQLEALAKTGRGCASGLRLRNCSSGR